MDIYKEIRESLLEGDAEKVCDLIEHAIKVKYPLERIFQDGLVEGANMLAEKFVENTVMVPEALMASRALNAGLDMIEEYLQKMKKYKAVAIIGTVNGDIHDVGKNIIKAIVTTEAIKVIDLGVNVPKEVFVKKIKEYKADIVMISTLLTTTMGEMKEVIEEIEKLGLREDVIIFVGGASVSEKYAKEIGADYYTSSVEDMKLFLHKNLNKILKQKRANRNKIEQQKK